MSSRNGSFFSCSSSAIFSISLPLATWYGISVTTICQVPPFSSSFTQRARTRSEPRPVL